jgi:putative ABC transport system permease protein
MMNSVLKQSGLLLGIGLASIRLRLLRALSTVAGAAGVVAVLVSLLSIAEGYDRVVRTSAAEESVRVLGSGSTAEIASNIPGDEVALLRNSPLVARDSEGRALLSAELYTSVRVAGRNGKDMNVSLRGVEPAAYPLTGVRIVSGRAPTSGRREVLVGRLAAQRLKGAGIGSDLRFTNSLWRVVGTFESDSGLAESELWVDAGALDASLDRGGAVQTLHLRLATGSSLHAFTQSLERDPRLHVRAFDQKEYLAEQSKSLRGFLEVMCYGITFLMGLGAAFAALGTSYASVSTRIREIGTYRALGFRGTAVFGSIIGESLLLTGVGGLIGAVGAYLVFDGLQTSTVMFSANYTQVAFAFAVSPAILVQAAALALIIGLAGSLYPAWRVLKLSIAQSCGERR